jgi:hypothetical protein
MAQEREHSPIAKAFQEGLRPGEISIESLRDACALAPEDLEKRARLLAALTFRRRPHPDPAPEFVNEVVWWIERHPDELQHVTPALAVLSHAPFAVYQRIRDAWNRTLSAREPSVDLILVAAQSFNHHEPDRALELLGRAHGAASHDGRAAWQAGHIWLLRSTRFRVGGPADHDPQEAAEALRWFEKALERRSSGEERGSTLTSACDAALAAGEYEKARAFAEELIASSASTQADWNLGNAIYVGHSTLGRIALREDAVERAKEHLGLAGRTPGSPQLNSFGPELELADELLQRGERDAVLEFLRAIRTFWRSGRDRIDLWVLRIERGETPRLSRFGRE